ncbi:HIT family hydrolase [Stigmatella aurantiaca DW4/3-1]|uniref:HIT family hydrolase n=1 Tax=Stigmatella aurantiaca (strain DW4/3-1) TaxID=378806 RepID=Q099F3_STIAD|nr:HIT family hydrolase [Stigmatella aurantiaca DW4/3-1]
MNEPCLGCAVVAGTTRPVGGVLARAPGLVVHGVAAPSALPGWLVISSERHVRAWYELDDEGARELGPLAARVMRAQREVLGAEHAYAFAIGDVLRHFHLHLVPRFAQTPRRLWGRGAFDATEADHLPASELEAAAQALAGALTR